MKFDGFPANTRFTPIPDIFINQLAPGMDAAEVTLILKVFNIVFNKKGYPRHVTAPELASHPSLRGHDAAGLLESAAGRGILLTLTSGDGTLYFINNTEGRRAITQAERGELKLQRISPVKPPPVSAPPDIFTLYEENIGLITPIIAEELKDAVDTYPEVWLRDAMKEAVSLNKRNWRYIQRILERWVAEGKNDYGKHQPDIERDKFIHGRYGGLVQR